MPAGWEWGQSISRQHYIFTAATSTNEYTHVLEQSQHLRVGRVIGDREGQVRVTQDGRNTDQSRATTGHNTHVLPGVLALLALAIVLIVQTGDGRPQRLDTGGRAIFPRSGGDGDGGRAGETALDLVVGLGGTLA